MTEDEIKIEAEEKPEQENLEDADLDTTGITIHSDVVDPEVSQVAGPFHRRGAGGLLQPCGSDHPQGQQHHRR